MFSRKEAPFLIKRNRPEFYDLEEGRYLCVLASGEQFVIKNGDYPTDQYSLVDELARITEESTSRGIPVTRLYQSAARVLKKIKLPNGKPGLNISDARYWAKQIASGSVWPEKLFPRWVFLSIAADLFFSHPFEENGPLYRRFQPGQRKKLIIRPSESELKEVDLRQEDVNKFLNETPPALIGKAIPVLGWFD
ncbi:unnamed protein product, partial [marine sediment metagenome]